MSSKNFKKSLMQIFPFLRFFSVDTARHVIIPLPHGIVVDDDFRWRGDFIVVTRAWISPAAPDPASAPIWVDFVALAQKLFERNVCRCFCDEGYVASVKDEANFVVHICLLSHPGGLLLPVIPRPPHPRPFQTSFVPCPRRPLCQGSHTRVCNSFLSVQHRRASSP